MRYILFFVSFVFTLGYWAQDGISPLTANPDLFGKKNLMTLKSTQATFDSTVVYLTDTLSLPFFDDFSRNNFQKYTATPGDGGLTEELYFSMLNKDTDAPLDATLKLTETRTYRSEYDPVADTTIIYYFDSIVFKYNNLATYSPNYELVYGYPVYIIFDTLETGNLRDTVWLTNEIDFFQDSARIFIQQINESNKLWLNEQAYHNYRFAVNPWSLGVVTFDGLDEYGYPYNFGSSINRNTDTLLAKPIKMGAVSASDSVYFSFLYQKGGFGDAPEADKDSLFLDFYSPITQEWKRVWRTNGGPTTDFQVAHVPVVHSDYFADGFQFRFISFTTPAGALDHFHIDYVNLRTSSGYQDTLFKDFAFVYPISTLLKDYISVPWKHYRANPTGKMSDAVNITVRNGSELMENNQNGEVKVYHEGALQGSFTLNASALSDGEINYAPRTTYSTLHDFSTGYTFNHALANDTMAYFDYIGVATAQFPNNPINDTTFSKQVFENYYAYDDGTAEKAYGVSGSQSMLAVKFKGYQADSLIGVKIHFVPSVVDVSQNLFLLTVWDDNNGKPGTVLYVDQAFYPNQPVYKSGQNAFHTYVFEDTMKVGVGETFYVGMRQIDEERLNIGFDMNHDNADKIFWSVDHGGHWYNASYPGSVMIRPIVTSNMDYTLGIENNQVEKPSYDFTIYPNPARSVLHFEGDNLGDQTSFQILDLNGRVVIQSEGISSIQVSHLQAGIYLVNRLENHQVISVKKLIIQ